MFTGVTASALPSPGMGVIKKCEADKVALKGEFTLLLQLYYTSRTGQNCNLVFYILTVNALEPSNGAIFLFELIYKTKAILILIGIQIHHFVTQIKFKNFLLNKFCV